jgi:hypothetical protein
VIDLIVILMYDIFPTKIYTGVKSGVPGGKTLAALLVKPDLLM